MSLTNYAGPSGLSTYDGWSRGDAYDAMERLPEVLRRRINDATVPIPPAFVLQYYEQQITRQGRSPDLAIRYCLDKLARTEQTAAETLERERETWTLGEDMAASMKAAHMRRLGKPAPIKTPRAEDNDGITELYGMKL